MGGGGIGGAELLMAGDVAGVPQWPQNRSPRAGFPQWGQEAKDP
jgi:hypothetical protein